MVDASNQNNDVGKEKKRAFDWTAFILAVFALLISGIAAYYAFRQADIAEDTAHRQLRAYIGIQITGWAVPSPTQVLAIHYAIIDYGETPAKMVHIDGQIEVDPFPLPENFAPTYWDQGAHELSNLFPHEPGTRGDILQKGSPPKVTIFKTVKDNERIYMFMRITYEDCFNIPHSTRMCLYIAHNNIVYRKDGTIKTFLWTPYGEFNDFD